MQNTIAPIKIAVLRFGSKTTRSNGGKRYSNRLLKFFLSSRVKRYEKKITETSLKNSEGWKLKKEKLICLLAPQASTPNPGIKTRIKKIIPNKYNRKEFSFTKFKFILEVIKSTIKPISSQRDCFLMKKQGSPISFEASKSEDEDINKSPIILKIKTYIKSKEKRFI